MSSSNGCEEQIYLLVRDFRFGQAVKVQFFEALANKEEARHWVNISAKSVLATFYQATLPDLRNPCQSAAGQPNWLQLTRSGAEETGKAFS